MKNIFGLDVKYLAFSIYCLALLCSFTASADIEREDINATIVYSVSAKGFRVGKIKTNIKFSDGKYTIESNTKASGFARLLLGGNVHDNCEFTFTREQGIKGLKYSSIKKGRGKYNNWIGYNWTGGILEANGGALFSLPVGHVLDNCNFYFAVSATDIELLQAGTIHVLDGKDFSLRSYVFEALETETIATRFGDLNTTKVTLVRRNNPARSLSFWLSDSYPLSPVRIVDQRKSRKVVLKLIVSEEDA